MTHYIVRSSAAKMPRACWGTYRRVAVIEVEAGIESVTMISARARGAVRIVRTWDACHVGTTERCAYARALTQAEALAARLNTGEVAA